MNTTSTKPSKRRTAAGFPPAPPEAHQKAALTQRERSAILAGLRLLQEGLHAGNIRPNDGWMGDILTNGGEHAGMTESEIDGLCEKLN